MVTLRQASDQWLETVKTARSLKTFETYRSARDFFFRTLRRKKIDANSAPPSVLDARAIGWLAADLKELSTYTEQAYLTAIKRFYVYMLAEDVIQVNIIAIQEMIHQRARRPGFRVPQFAEDEITQLIDFMRKLTPRSEERNRLIDLRDRALILVLPATGLRIHEALKLTRGDIDWRRKRAIIIGKGDTEAVVLFTSRALRALRDYLDARAKLDGGSGRPLVSLPLFARHDKGAGSKVRAITTETARAIIEERVRQVFGDRDVQITPHSFRHYFATRIQAKKGNLKLTQALMRHKNIQNTARYAHLADKVLEREYREVMEEDDAET